MREADTRMQRELQSRAGVKTEAEAGTGTEAESEHDVVDVACDRAGSRKLGPQTESVGT